MVKRATTLAEIEAEAGVPYERTRLARQARRSRVRLAVLLAVGALLMVVEALVQRGGGWVAGALALGALAWGVRAGRLSAVVGAALAGVLAALLPLRLLVVTDPAPETLVALGASAILGLATLPDILTLLRDAELQHAYGLWARRDDERV